MDNTSLIQALNDRRDAALLEADRYAAAIMCIDPAHTVRPAREESPVGASPFSAPAEPRMVGYDTVYSDSNPGAEYYVSIFEGSRGRCTCASYVRGNATCKHLRRMGLSRVDGVTTPPRALLPVRLSDVPLD